jgi:hypothetical protein
LNVDLRKTGDEGERGGKYLKIMLIGNVGDEEMNTPRAFRR